MTVHWIGTGLSAIPGLRRLIREGRPVVVWNRTEARARKAVGDLTDDIRAYSLEALAAVLQPGDIVVSMLPADQHYAIARLCVESGAHFVCSSYLSPEMVTLHSGAERAGVTLMNEIGLDPGIDHLMAHDLVADYGQMAQPGDKVFFTSYCGGIPKYVNTFRYKFSWSPLGVLRALRTPARYVRDGQVRDAARPWHAVQPYDAPLPTPERFEVYPNRDSTSFVARYGFSHRWDLQEFVRGTIRLKGWKEAWTPIFAEIESLQGEAGEARLHEMADQLWRANAYARGEADRVVMCVGLRGERDGAVIWHKEWVLDAHGGTQGSAMARLVSVPVALAVDAIAAGRLEPGVLPATDDPELIAAWLVEIAQFAQHLAKVNHLRA